jgi:hydrogenase-4 component F
MSAENLLWLAVLAPATLALSVAIVGGIRSTLTIVAVGSMLSSALNALIAAFVFARGPLVAGAGWFRVDALSACHLALLAIVGGGSGLYAVIYLAEENRHGTLTRRQARVFTALWCGTLAALTFLLVSNNLGLMWVGLETTTLLTAFLIALHVSRESLEAMWKYLLICSVAIAFAFMGTLLAAAAATTTHTGSPQALFWTGLVAVAPRLDPALMRAAFLFLVVGYGTKAGLAPMHNWLPDAHSQAPAPVSALFSCFMLNASLYCTLRFIPVMERVPGCAGWAQSLLLGFGLISILVGAGFILFQHDAKRLLAYCSVEHIGLIALGVGLGGLGTVAALLHSVNHSMAKGLAFFATGRLGQAYGTHDIARMAGAMRTSRVWGAALLASCLALVGAAPFATFLSEFLLLKAIFDRGRMALLVAVLAALGLAFVGLMRHTIRLAWARGEEPPRRITVGFADVALVGLTVAALLVLGFVVPAPLRQALEAAAAVVQATSPATLAAGVHP